jgi:hypothetical protein
MHFTLLCIESGAERHAGHDVAGQQDSPPDDAHEKEIMHHSPPRD